MRQTSQKQCDVPALANEMLERIDENRKLIGLCRCLVDGDEKAASFSLSSLTAFVMSARHVEGTSSLVRVNPTPWTCISESHEFVSGARMCDAF